MILPIDSLGTHWKTSQTHMLIDYFIVDLENLIAIKTGKQH